MLVTIVLCSPVKVISLYSFLRKRVQAFNAPVDADSLSELLESVAKIQKAVK